MNDKLNIAKIIYEFSYLTTEQKLKLIKDIIEGAGEKILAKGKDVVKAVKKGGKEAGRIADAMHARYIDKVKVEPGLPGGDELSGHNKLKLPWDKK